jgi:hypothetical protein
MKDLRVVQRKVEFFELALTIGNLVLEFCRDVVLETFCNLSFDEVIDLVGELLFDLLAHGLNNLVLQEIVQDAYGSEVSKGNRTGVRDPRKSYPESQQFLPCASVLDCTFVVGDR